MIQRTLGIVGGGQLGKMLAIAASSLGIESSFIDPSPMAVSRTVARQILAAYDDLTSISSLFKNCTAVTYEFENVSVDALLAAGDALKLAPSLEALLIASDRVKEKEFFQSCGLKVAPYKALFDCDQLAEQEFLDAVFKQAELLEFPVIVKTCSLGYDGKGQCSLSSAELELEQREQLLALRHAKRLVVEKKIGFAREFSLIAVRSRTGQIKVYPIPTNVHRNGILFSSIVTEPDVPPELTTAVSMILEKLKYVGVLALEFFDLNGEFLVNEMAPRVHNSGHWTIEGTVTSQFENHVRAVLDLALGDTGLRFPTAMLNIIGAVPDVDQVLAIDGTHLHLYGKSERVGRKLGHITVEAKSEKHLRNKLARLISLLR